MRKTQKAGSSANKRGKGKGKLKRGGGRNQ